ncbi:conjugative transposon protein TraN [Terrimonas alba]|uniref:conjugative transposon protein TraN n=1 Tax=Terrimonas alba TaxID=3349636 RepID=UPI0035F3275C
MNWYRMITLMLLTGTISFHLFGQPCTSFSASSYIIPYKLEVAFTKTTHLVFPSSIHSIDRGSEAILVEKATGVENILRVKAAAQAFEETSLSVITRDGRLYSFLVSYNPQPPYLNVTLGTGTDLPAPELKILSQQVLLQPRTFHSVHDESAGMSLLLEGFYIQGGTMFCRLRIKNDSNIDYRIDQFRFYIRDQKLSKRTAKQEIEIPPSYILGDSSGIKGGTTETLVIAVPQFTIPDGKYLVIEIMERNGGRHLALKVKNRHIGRTRSL